MAVSRYEFQALSLGMFVAPTLGCMGWVGLDSLMRALGTDSSFSFLIGLVGGVSGLSIGIFFAKSVYRAGQSDFVLARSRNPHYRALAAENGSRAVLASLVHDPADVVRTAVARSKRSDSALLLLLSDDRSKPVLEAVTARYLDKVRSHTERDDLRRAVARAHNNLWEFHGVPRPLPRVMRESWQDGRIEEYWETVSWEEWRRAKKAEEEDAKRELEEMEEEERMEMNRRIYESGLYDDLDDPEY